MESLEALCCLWEVPIARGARRPLAGAARGSAEGKPRREVKV